VLEELLEQEIQEQQEVVELVEMEVVEHHLPTLEDTMVGEEVLEEIPEHIITEVVPLLMVVMVDPALQEMVEMEDLVMGDPITITDRVAEEEEQMWEIQVLREIQVQQDLVQQHHHLLPLGFH
jgi:hypothetical protein